jgi:hypothetical protein
MTFAKCRLLKVKPFGKTPGNLLLQTPRNAKDEENKWKMRPAQVVGWWGQEPKQV